MPIFCRVLSIAETNSGVFGHSKCWGSHEPITAYFCKNPQASFLSVPDQAVVLKNFLNPNLPSYLLVSITAYIQVCKLVSVLK